ncbi:MAG: ATPase, T2SS/T4P/T4SS family, partial [Candidatus Wallbacteria bacterium]|nr:ATPase, T2SS/T4P/T4SS family [Candidatus Wallbacteria bacterium]
AFGDSAVLKPILKKDPFQIEELGMHPQQIWQIRKNLLSSHGLIVISGPAGSGKTATLHSLLSLFNKTSLKIVCIDNFPETPFSGRVHVRVQSSQVDPSPLNQETGLQTCLTMDPDVIALSDLDEHTAAGALRLSLSGRLIIMTMNANSALEAVQRLSELGISREMLISNLRLVISQRLVPALCEKCKEKVDPAAYVKILNMPESDYQGKDFFRAKGCSVCSLTGSSGRTGCFELLELTESLKKVLVNKDPMMIRKVAVREGMTTLSTAAFLKCTAGKISIEEFVKIAFDLS